MTTTSLFGFDDNCSVIAHIDQGNSTSPLINKIDLAMACSRATWNCRASAPAPSAPLPTDFVYEVSGRRAASREPAQ